MSIWGLPKRHIEAICAEVDRCEQAQGGPEAIAQCMAAVRPHMRKVMGSGMRLSAFEKLLEASSYDRARKLAQELAREPTFLALAIFMLLVFALGMVFVQWSS